MRDVIQLCSKALLLALVIVPAMLGNARCAHAQENPYPGRAPAPSLDGGTEWLNTSGEISLKDLRGKIVLLDFWTYCCINCIHVIPDLKYLEKKYENQLVVIGVHSAKFTNERETENIRQAILRYEIEHPVVNDSNFIIARKYGFNSWPTLVLIDPEGNYVGRQPGEGTRELFDQVIGKLVAYHRSKGTLDETPLRFDLEKNDTSPTPLKYPGKVLVDPANDRLFISDSNHNRIVISTLDGKLIDVIGSGQIGSKSGSYDEAQFDHPQGMALVGNKLYVADTENHLIREIDLEKKRVMVLAGTRQQARMPVARGLLHQVPLNSPWDLTHLNGSLYIAMAGPHQLWEHKLGSNVIAAFAGNGREDIIDGPRSAASLAQPSGITHDGSKLYHVDSEGSAVRQVTLGREGDVTTLVGAHDMERGASLFEFGDVDGIGDQARLQHPLGIVYHDGKLYVADTYNDKIKQVDIGSRRATTWLGTGTSGDGLDPVQLNEPGGLALANGQLYIADTNNHRLLVADLTTKATRELVIEGLTPPAEPSSATAEEEIDLSNAIEVPAVTAGRSNLKVNVSFELPDGYKLNQLAAVSYRIVAQGTQEIVDPEAIGKRKRAEKTDTSASFEIPLTGKSGSADLAVSVSYQYCRDGVGAVCRFATQAWKLPLSTGAGGVDRIELTATPQEAR